MPKIVSYLLSLLFFVVFGSFAHASELIDARPLTESIVQLVFKDGTAVHETAGSGVNGQIIESELDVGLAMTAGSYRISNTNDPDFSTGVRPLSVGRKAKGTEFARTAQWVLGHALTHWVYIELPFPMKSGKRYTIDVGVLSSSTNTFAFLFDEQKTRSEAVQVNQVGYLPDAPEKFAYLSHWMGTSGPLSLDAYSNRSFHVINQSTEEALFSGVPKLRERRSDKDDHYVAENHAGADVWELNFSAFTNTGAYRIAVDGIGCSFPFEIGADVYREAFRTTARGLYHQRCGIPLEKQYTKYVRPRCHHPDDRTILQSTHKKMTKGNAFQELPETATEEKVEYWGGYHDAGDWDRGVQHLSVSDDLLLVYELAPEKFTDGELGIPESSNGIPDIVDEARFNLDCYKRMQKEDGGVCGGLESAGHPNMGDTAWDDSLPLFAYAPDADASFRFAATASRMHGTMLELGRGDAAGEYLKAAEKAWEWALEKESDPGVSKKVRDLKLHAAAQLFHSTGKDCYHDAFKTNLMVKTETSPLCEWGKYDQKWAVWTYAMIDRPEVDPELKEMLRQATVTYVRSNCIDTARRRARRYGYNWYKPYGHTSATTPFNLGLIVAYEISGDEAFRGQMLLNCDNCLGGNPLNMVWVTGLGDRPCKAVLHHDSLYGQFGQDDPVAGIVPYGPLRFKSYDGKCNWTHSWGQKTAFPAADTWPYDELWFGNYMSPAAAEFTVTESIGPAAAAYGYLCADQER